MLNRKLSFGSTLLILLTVVLTAVVSFVHFLESPLSSRGDAIIFTLQPGTSATSMIKDLQKQGMLNPLQAKFFSVILYCKGAQKSLKAGEYHLTFDMTPEALYTKLMKGEVVLHSVRFPEAATFEEVLQLIMQNPSVKKSLQGKSMQEILSNICPACMSPEGILFPDTYYFRSNTSDVSLLQMAFNTMNAHLQKEWKLRSPNLVLKSPYEVLILASIIEKEASIVEERALISGVFQQRLAKKMRLQADPTVVYGLGKAYSGRITAEDLKRDTPYNTYVHAGLPPSPIALPSLQSIHAACHPTVTDKLYFVAKGDGSHYFSATLEEHNQAVLQYQKLSETKQ